MAMQGDDGAMPGDGLPPTGAVRPLDDAEVERCKIWAQHPHGRSKGYVMPEQEISEGSKPISREVCDLKMAPFTTTLGEIKANFAAHEVRHETARIEQRSSNRWAIGILIPVALSVGALVLEMVAGKF